MSRKRNWDYLYDKYNKAYDKKEASGFPMMPRMDKDTFRREYKIEEDVRRYQIQNGIRKTKGAINRDLVNNQVDYPISESQARHLAEAARNLGEKPGRWTELRKNIDLQDRLYGQIDKHYRELKKAGYSGKEALAMIGRDFYGSP